MTAARPDSASPADDSEDASAPRAADAVQERLQKIIAAAGVASRRKAEELITAGRVQVNGQTVTALGAKADPARDHIRVDGKLLHAERPRYVVLNKPKGYVTTVSDPQGRPTVLDLLRHGKHGGERLFPVGRLDYSSEGLLLLTNDGPLANALTRAAAGVEKVYLVKVSGHPSESSLNQLRHGVMIDRDTQIKPRLGKTDARPDAPIRRSAARVMTAPARIRVFRDAENPWYELILTEGRNREIRKMFEEIGHHVEKIRRIGYGPLALDLEPGHSRELTPDEVSALRRAAEGKNSRPARKAPKPGRKPEFRRNSPPKGGPRHAKASSRPSRRTTGKAGESSPRRRRNAH